MASSARSAQPSLIPGRFAARVLPAFLVLLLSAGYAVWVLSRANWDPRVFADLGSRYALGQANGSEGYDGQFNYFIALDPRPQFVASRLDVPAYRYQRILYPLLARVVSGANPTILPWALLGINLVSVAVATLLTSELLRNRGASPWHSIPFGLWVGLLGSLRTDLSEPLAFALVALAVLLDDRGLPAGSGLLFALAAFAKETTLVFLLAWAIWGWVATGQSRAFLRRLLPAVPFAVFQVWLYLVFGSFGIGSGGAQGTPFELVPFLGLLRAGQSGSLVLAVLAAVYAPGILVPAVWGILSPLRQWLRKQATLESLFLFASALALALAPFSTFREPLGITRLASGMILAGLLQAARQARRSILRYAWVGLAYLAFIVG
ncbi:MAG: hypothetical protein ABSF61_01820 [Anaerolineales bacterium]